MKIVLIGNTTGTVSVQGFLPEFFEEQTQGFLTRELVDGESALPHRYGVVDGVITDMYPTLTDEQINQRLLTPTALASNGFQLSPTEFLRFLGAMRRIAIRSLAKAGDPVAEDLLDMFNRVPYISSTDTDLQNGLLYLENLPNETFGGANPFVGVVTEFAETGKTFIS